MANGVVVRSNRVLQVLQTIVLVVVAIYFGRPVLLPIAMAILFTFLLRPVLIWLERRGLPRPIAVVVVVAALMTGFGIVGWQVAGHLGELANNLPSYRENLRAKITDLRGSGRGMFKNIQETVRDVETSLKEELPEEMGTPAADESNREAPAVAEQTDGDEVIAAEVAAKIEDEIAEERVEAGRAPDEPGSGFETLGALFNTIGEPLAILAIVVVLTIFMLMEYEELRNRLVRLAGTGKITVTTKALDEAGKRISRYLLMNALVNGSFGLAVWIGLTVIGVEYAPLWGFLAATLRFVPYVGPIVASVLPIGMAIIQFPGWTQPLIVVAYWITIELITNNVIEPLAYGKSAGVSTVALLVAAAFWTWAWGPLGLILSVPMTVILAVLGRQIPQLEPLGILLGDSPALPPAAILYQRLLAGDVDEAEEVLEENFAVKSRSEVYDTIVVPALTLAERDRNANRLSEDEKNFVWDSTREMIEDEAFAAVAAKAEPELESGAVPHARVRVVGCPAHDSADELALVMLDQLLPAHVTLEIVPDGTLVAEVVSRLTAETPDVVCISALGPGGLAQTRYLIKRIRQAHPAIRIIVGRWDYRGDRGRMAEGLRRRGASSVVFTLDEACDQIQRVLPLPGTSRADGAEKLAGPSKVKV